MGIILCSGMYLVTDSDEPFTFPYNGIALIERMKAKSRKSRGKEWRREHEWKWKFMMRAEVGSIKFKLEPFQSKNQKAPQSVCCSTFSFIFKFFFSLFNLTFQDWKPNEKAAASAATSTDINVTATLQNGVYTAATTNDNHRIQTRGPNHNRSLGV